MASYFAIASPTATSLLGLLARRRSDPEPGAYSPLTILGAGGGEDLDLAMLIQQIQQLPRPRSACSI